MSMLRERSRPARRKIAKLLFDFPEDWDHANAQRYEIEHARQTILAAFPQNYAQWETQSPNFLYFNANDQWFCGDAALFDQFRNHIDDKSCLEIGSGPFGHLGQSKALCRRVIIDPLIDAYRDIELREFGKTFFTPDIETHACAAETKVNSVVGAINGLIVCRNCLDHCDDPLTVLANIAEYAAPDCWFFLWTDIWHREIDAGHKNITRSAVVMRALLGGFGFEIIREGRPIRDPADYLEFGCIARKR